MAKKRLPRTRMMLLVLSLVLLVGICASGVTFAHYREKWTEGLTFQAASVQAPTAAWNGKDLTITATGTVQIRLICDSAPEGVTLTVDGNTYSSSVREIESGSTFEKCEITGWVMSFVDGDGQELELTMSGQQTVQFSADLSEVKVWLICQGKSYYFSQGEATTIQAITSSEDSDNAQSGGAES